MVYDVYFIFGWYWNILYLQVNCNQILGLHWDLITIFVCTHYLINRDLCIIDNQVNEHNVALGAIQSSERKCLTPKHP
jgi:hypothetical protein